MQKLSRTLLPAREWGLRLDKALVLLLQLSVGRACLFPILGELAGAEAVRGGDRSGVASRPCGFVRRPLEALLPELLQGLALRLQVCRRLEGEGEGRGCEGGEAPWTAEGSDGLPREIWARRAAIGGGPPVTGGAMEQACASIAALEATAALAAHQSASPQRRAMTHRAHRLGTGSLGGEAGEMRCRLRPGARGRHMVFSQHMRGGTWASHPPRTGAAGVLFAGIDLASALGGGAGIHRGLQQVLPRHALGPAPLQGPLGGALPHADPEWNVLLHQRAHERMPRAKVVTCAKEQPDHMLALFIRIVAHLAGRVVDIANGEGAQRSAPRRACCTVPCYRRCLRRWSSASRIVPCNPNHKRSVS
jgi:hypothetical protein